MKNYFVTCYAVWMIVFASAAFIGAINSTGKDLWVGLLVTLFCASVAALLIVTSQKE